MSVENDDYRDRPNKREETTHLEIATNALFSDFVGIEGDEEIARAYSAIRRVIKRRREQFTARTGVEWGRPRVVVDRHDPG